MSLERISQITRERGVIQGPKVVVDLSKDVGPLVVDLSLDVDPLEVDLSMVVVPQEVALSKDVHPQEVDMAMEVEHCIDLGGATFHWEWRRKSSLAWNGSLPPFD